MVASAPTSRSAASRRSLESYVTGPVLDPTHARRPPSPSPNPYGKLLWDFFQQVSVSENPPAHCFNTARSASYLFRVGAPGRWGGDALGTREKRSIGCMPGVTMLPRFPEPVGDGTGQSALPGSQEKSREWLAASRAVVAPERAKAFDRGHAIHGVGRSSLPGCSATCEARLRCDHKAAWPYQGRPEIAPA